MFGFLKKALVGETEVKVEVSSPAVPTSAANAINVTASAASDQITTDDSAKLVSDDSINKDAEKSANVTLFSSTFQNLHMPSTKSTIGRDPLIKLTGDISLEDSTQTTMEQTVKNCSNSEELQKLPHTNGDNKHLEIIANATSNSHEKPCSTNAENTSATLTDDLESSISEVNKVLSKTIPTSTCEGQIPSTTRQVMHGEKGENKSTENDATWTSVFTPLKNLENEKNPDMKTPEGQIKVGSDIVAIKSSNDTVSLSLSTAVQEEAKSIVAHSTQSTDTIAHSPILTKPIPEDIKSVEKSVLGSTTDSLIQKVAVSDTKATVTETVTPTPTPTPKSPSLVEVSAVKEIEHNVKDLTAEESNSSKLKSVASLDGKAPAIVEKNIFESVTEIKKSIEITTHQHTEYNETVNLSAVDREKEDRVLTESVQVMESAVTSHVEEVKEMSAGVKDEEVKEMSAGVKDEEVKETSAGVNDEDVKKSVGVNDVSIGTTDHILSATATAHVQDLTEDADVASTDTRSTTISATATPLTLQLNHVVHTIESDESPVIVSPITPIGNDIVAPVLSSDRTVSTIEDDIVTPVIAPPALSSNRVVYTIEDDDVAPIPLPSIIPSERVVYTIEDSDDEVTVLPNASVIQPGVQSVFLPRRSDVPAGLENWKSCLNELDELEVMARSAREKREAEGDDESVDMNEQEESQQYVVDDNEEEEEEDEDYDINADEEIDQSAPRGHFIGQSSLEDEEAAGVYLSEDEEETNVHSNGDNAYTYEEMEEEVNIGQKDNTSASSYSNVGIERDHSSGVEPIPPPIFDSNIAAQGPHQPFVPGASDKLPIDAYREVILERIKRDRVTIIHGETGCGKSSRLPVILLEDAESRGAVCRMMVSQPRRIAASSLMKRVRASVGDKVGMRMGHGVRDEFDGTCIHFVTTGYLVRLVAHHPETFEDHTHLIIDEVHERSVDGDLLCLLARRLLSSFPSLRLVLMSATVHTALYKNYFARELEYYGEMECLSVGAHRYPLDINYLEDLYSPKKGFPSMIASVARNLADRTSQIGSKSKDDVPQSVPKEQYNLVVSIIKAIGVEGTGILVFVSGIADITELTERFEGMSKYKLYAIHSDLPFEEQEAAFTPAAYNEIKVVVATNAAESSITLPDVDTVICLGTHKALRYDQASHKVQLVNTWISKASSTQRAGRTGRVRPGRVFRLYSRQLFAGMQEHEESEVHRTPLQDVILGLRSMLEASVGFSGVVPILEDLLEPPNMKNVSKSFDYLHYAGMITVPADEGALTSIGRLAGNLPVDLQLGRLIAYGVALGVPLEATIMAAALSQPKSPFRIASAMIHSDPDEYNSIVQQTVIGAALIDGGVYSEPIMYLKMILGWHATSSMEQEEWASRHGIIRSRLRQLDSTAVHLIQKVKDGLRRSQNQSYGRSDEENDMGLLAEKYKFGIPAEKLNILRLILTWTSEGNVIKQKKKGSTPSTDCYTVTLGEELSAAHVAPLFPPSVPWALETRGRRIYDARFSPARENGSGRSLLLSLASVGDIHGASAVWMVQQPAGAVASKKQVNKKKGKVDTENDSDNEYGEVPGDTPGTFITIAIQATPGQPPLAVPAKSKKNKGGANNQQPVPTGPLAILKANIRNNRLEYDGRSSIIVRNNGVPDFNRGPQPPTIEKVIDLYRILNPSNSEMKILKKLHDTLPVSISLLIPASGSPKVTASNCVLAKPELRYIFFNNEDAVDRVEDYNQKYGGGVPAERGPHHIAEKIVASKQQLVFPNPALPLVAPSDLILSPHGLNERTNKTSTDKSLILDVPIGMRLLNSYRLGYKDRIMRLWRNPTSSRGFGNDRFKTGVMRRNPGQDYFSREKDLGLAPGIPGPPGLAPPPSMIPMMSHKAPPVDDKILLGMQNLSFAWYCIPTLGGSTGVNRGSDPQRKPQQPPKALLPRQSLSAVATHCGKGTLYGVAHSTMAIGAGGGIVGCEGVTLLPPGSRWLTLALQCLQVDTRDIDQDFDEDHLLSGRNKSVKGGSNSNNNLNGTDGNVLAVVDYPVTEEDFELCDVAASLVRDLPSLPVQTHPALIATVTHLFREWLPDYNGGGRTNNQPFNNNSNNGNANKNNNGNNTNSNGKKGNKKDEKKVEKKSFLAARREIESRVEYEVSDDDDDDDDDCNNYSSGIFQQKHINSSKANPYTDPRLQRIPAPVSTTFSREDKMPTKMGAQPQTSTNGSSGYTYSIPGVDGRGGRDEGRGGRDEGRGGRDGGRDEGRGGRDEGRGGRDGGRDEGRGGREEGRGGRDGGVAKDVGRNNGDKGFYDRDTSGRGGIRSDGRQRDDARGGRDEGKGGRGGMRGARDDGEKGFYDRDTSGRGGRDEGRGGRDEGRGGREDNRDRGNARPSTMSSGPITGRGDEGGYRPREREEGGRGDASTRTAGRGMKRDEGRDRNGGRDRGGKDESAMSGGMSIIIKGKDTSTSTAAAGVGKLDPRFVPKPLSRGVANNQRPSGGGGGGGSRKGAQSLDDDMKDYSRFDSDEDDIGEHWKDFADGVIEDQSEFVQNQRSKAQGQRRSSRGRRGGGSAGGGGRADRGGGQNQTQGSDGTRRIVMTAENK